MGILPGIPCAMSFPRVRFSVGQLMLGVGSAACEECGVVYSRYRFCLERAEEHGTKESQLGNTCARTVVILTALWV